MKYLKIFEDFNNFTDVFDGKLIRGSKFDKNEYIDDPKLRKVSSGTSTDEDYIAFLTNYAKLGIPNPLKSVHMFFRPTEYTYSFFKGNLSYGIPYKIIPEKGAIFGFNKELRNGGLGSTWFFPDRTAKDFLNIEIDEYENFKEDKLYYTDKNKFFQEITEYQKMLIDAGVVGTLTYEELLEMSHEKGPTLQVWTESTCLHQKIN